MIDGDTIEIHGQRIRLHGIDSPEGSQTCTRNNRRWRCGQQAALALDRKIAQQPVTCRQTDKDRYGRIVARCWVEGNELNAWLVAEGWAVAYRRYSTLYVDEERSAELKNKGIWSGTFVKPEDWR